MIASVTGQARAELRQQKKARAASAGAIDRLPPHSIPAEQGVLGCIMLSPNEALNRCAELFRQFAGAVFYDLRHQLIYSAMQALRERMQAVDVITLQEELKKMERLEQVGGIAYLMTLPDTVPSAANLEYYTSIVMEKALMRRAVTVCTDIVGRLYDFEGDVQQALLQAESEIAQLTEFAQGAPEEKHIREVMLDVLDDMEQWHYSRGSQQLRGLPTGPAGQYIDKILMGVRPTQYVTVAARPGGGKSAWAMNIVEHLARDHVWFKKTGRKVLHEDGKEVDEMVAVRGVPVAVFSIEMDIESLGYRLLFGRAGVDEAQWNQGFAKTGDQEKLQQAAAELAQTNIYLDDTPGQTIGMIAAKARRMAKQYGIQLFVLDYIQLATSDDPRDDERTMLRKISKKIMALKKQLKVPWLVLAQMNRNIETAERDRAPLLSDLQGCGSLEQDSDKIIILKNPSLRELEKNAKGGPTDKEIIQEACADWEWSRIPRRVDAWVVKNRRGPLGKAEFVFQGNLCRFEDWHMWKVRHGVEARHAGESKSMEGDASRQPDRVMPTNEELGLD